jgi:hypothetical protein
MSFPISPFHRQEHTFNFVPSVIQDKCHGHLLPEHQPAADCIEIALPVRYEIEKMEEG